MRSSAGVGITPPNVLDTPKPASSVMISRMFGAPFGGTIRGAQQGFDSRASRLITPPNGSGCGGNCLSDLSDCKPAGEQGSDAGSCGNAPLAAIAASDRPASTIRRIRTVNVLVIPPLPMNDS